MKNIKYLTWITSLLVAFLLITMSCSDQYYEDGGVLEPNVGRYDGNTMSYLKSRPKQFDSLTTLIELCELTGVVNTSGTTFFAPQNYSIYNYLKLVFPDATKMPKSLKDLPHEELNKIKEMLKNYIIPGKNIVREDLSTTYVYHENYNGKQARFNLVREDYLGNVNMGARYIMFGLNTSTNPLQERYQTVKVVTADITTSTGIVHVVETDTHILGFN